MQSPKGVDAKFASLLENLKVEDPWVPPKTWESIPSESGLRPSFPFSSHSDQLLSALSESSLVRLVMNGLEGVKSSLLSIQKLSAIFCCDPADRTSHQISSLWNRASSTHSLGNILTSIGCTGSLVFLLREFVGYFTNTNVQDSFRRSHDSSDVFQSHNHQEAEFPPYSLVNQAFAVAVGKVLEGYICGLDTVHASVVLRCSSKGADFPVSGCLKSVVHSDITLLEFYLHTKELRTQIEALASICNLQKWALRFSDISLGDLITEATSEFCNFCRGGDLLTFLYAQLQVADPAHCTLLKFLFLQSCEPYCGFIRSWIFKAEIHDPYKEFIVENMECLPPKSHVEAGYSVDFPLTRIRVRDEISVPGFLKDFLVPLVRAGQQLQVLLKLLELCVYVAAGDHSSDDFLPCWSGFSSSTLSYSSPLTFSRDIIEAMVLARESYYKKMNEKIESLLSSLEVRYQQVAMHVSVPFRNGGGTLDKLGQLMEDDESIVRPTDKRSSNMDVDSLGSDASSTVDEFSLLDDMYGSSESLSLNGSEEQLDSDKLCGWPCLIVGQQNHLSALTFSKGTTLNGSILNCCHHEKSGRESPGICDKTDAIDHVVKTFHEGMIKSTEKHHGSLRYSMLCQDVITVSDNLRGEATSEDQPDNTIPASNLCTFQPQKVGHKCNLPSINPLSMNPMLTRNVLLRLMGRDGEKCKADHELPLPYFNFSTVENPCKVYIDKLPTNSRCRSASSIPLGSSVSTSGDKNNQYGKMGHGKEDNPVDVPKHCLDASLDLMDHKQDVSASVSGGSRWERLLGSFRKSVNCDATHDQSLLSTFEIPLDIIIDKCLLQEIMLQYKYVSKLTINVLEEAFELQEHLLALRRYHFMELADWADLFILSLWHHKWSVTEANERLSEIQGLLELSIQKSSCEQDPNKDRLFVYMKGHGKLPLSTSAIGVRTFDFLGLGYHVDWPLSIVLTPAALKIYADIFSFLIQVKLAIFSLTDVWCSLKDLMHTKKDLNCELHQHEAGHLNILMKMRHQISHFVSTLQQYVESQLSHVSWCKFLHSLQHKVKDMMDLESVHMEYLADSLCICFLSDETREVGGIIESILQCALDFRSCLTVGAWNAESGQENLLGRLSRINIAQGLYNKTFPHFEELRGVFGKDSAQGANAEDPIEAVAAMEAELEIRMDDVDVNENISPNLDDIGVEAEVLSIKQKFDRSLKELHICYIKEPRHGNFGVSRFWDNLNYNKYYSHVINEMGYYGL